MAWLTDAQLHALASRSGADAQLWSSRYDPSCPSEWYRGYASCLYQLRSRLADIGRPDQAAPIIDSFDAEVRTWPAGNDQLLPGAQFANMNAWAYMNAATTAHQILHTLDLELVTIAHCFHTNRGKGL